MDWNTILLTLTLLGCASLLWRSIRHRGAIIWGWLGVVIFIVALTAGVWLQRRDWAGFVGFAAWTALVMGPTLFAWQARQQAGARRFGAAYWWAFLAAMLHPFDGYLSEVRMVGAMRLWREGNAQQALEILARLAAKSASSGFIAECQRLRIEQRWPELATWIEMGMDDRMLAQRPELAALLIRALGESGDPNAAVAAFSQLTRAPAPVGDMTRVRARLFTLAFGGRTQGARQIMERMRPALPTESRDLWQMTAEQAAGNVEAARPTLDTLAFHATPDIAQSARKRIEHPVPPASELFPEAVVVLDELDRRVLADGAGQLSGRKARAPITWLLILVNVAVFIAEIFAGGSTEDSTLQKMGGLYPDLVAQHQYWRLLTANFLHFGWEHILFNMVALLILGPFVEASLGAVRYLVVYFVCGIGAMTGVLWLQRLHVIQPEALVGASGAIMGLVGVTGAGLLRQWRRQRGAESRQRFVRIVWIVVLQVIFDALTPEASSSAHLIGLGWGVVLGFVFWDKPATLQ